jgi:hypothetical protein
MTSIYDLSVIMMLHLNLNQEVHKSQLYLQLGSCLEVDFFKINDAYKTLTKKFLTS